MRESELLFDELWLNNFFEKVYRDFDIKIMVEISKWFVVINSIYWKFLFCKLYKF